MIYIAEIKYSFADITAGINLEMVSAGELEIMQGFMPTPFSFVPFNQAGVNQYEKLMRECYKNKKVSCQKKQKKQELCEV